MSLIMGAKAPKLVCVLLHGRGQRPEEMAGHVVDRLHLPGVQFRLPRALSGSWYDARAVDPLNPRTLAQLDAALDMVAAEIAAVPGLPVLLAGFSQGACLALEFVLGRQSTLAGLCLLTGCRVGNDAGGPVRALHGLPVYAACGDADNWIPLDRFGAAILTLAQSGARVRADVFPGREHEVSDPEIATLTAMLEAVSEGREVLA